MATRTAKVVVSLAVFAAIGVILLGPASTVVADNTGTTSVTNETVYADYNESSDLRGYDINPGSETVWVLNDSSGNYEQATSPDDYSLNEDPGTIDFNSSSTLVDSGDEVKVTYDYAASDELTALVAGFLPLGMGLLIFVAVANRATGMM